MQKEIGKGREYKRRKSCYLRDWKEEFHSAERKQMENKKETKSRVVRTYSVRKMKEMQSLVRKTFPEDIIHRRGCVCHFTKNYCDATEMKRPQRSIPALSLDNSY